MVEDKFPMLSYDPDTGCLCWTIARGPMPAGSVAGTLMPDGYIRVRYEGRFVLAHRIAWAKMVGRLPAMQIDHINGDRADNRFQNLREVSQSENQQNRSQARVDSKYKFMGAHFIARRSVWLSYIKINGKRKHLGYFKSAEDAHNRYLSAKKLMHPAWVRPIQPIATSVGDLSAQSPGEGLAS